MDSDKFIEDIDDYLIIRKEEYTLDQISVCRDLKERIFSDEPYGIGTRPLFDLEQVSLQDALDALDSVDPDHVVFFDLVYFYRTGEIDDCTDRKEYIICGLFDMFITLMRARLQDVLGVPEVVFTIYRQSNPWITEEWSDVVNTLGEYESKVIRINESVIKDVDQTRQYIADVKEDKVFNIFQNIEYHSTRSDVVCCENALIVRDTAYTIRTILNRGYKGSLDILPWLVFNSMDYSELVYFSEVCKSAYSLYHSKREDNERVRVRISKKSPNRIKIGGIVCCSRHRVMFCSLNDHRQDNCVDFENSIYSFSEYKLLQEIYRSLSRKQRNWLFRMVVTRNEYQSLAVTLTFMFLVASVCVRADVKSLIEKYKSFFRLGITMTRRPAIGPYVSRMIDNSSFTMAYFTQAYGNMHFMSLPSKICNGFPTSPVFRDNTHGQDMCKIKYPSFDNGTLRIRERKKKRFQKKRRNKF